MTPEDLEVIRARDAAPYGVSADVVRLIEDRRALLAALDEANAECARSKAEVDRLTADVQRVRDEWAEDHFYQLGRAAGATYAERARIRAAVERLESACHSRSGLYCEQDAYGWCYLISRAAVLAAIEGGEACLHRTWLTMDPPVCADCGKVGEA